MAIRDSMQASAAPYLQQGETIQAVFGAQTASQWLAALTGVFVFLGLNRYRIFVVTPARILILDAGKTSMAKAKGVVTGLPRATKLGPGTGLWHVIPGMATDAARAPALLQGHRDGRHPGSGGGLSR